MELPMAAIKIQSLEDVVEAYCRSLGYNGKNLEQAVAAINGHYLEKINAEDIITSLDNILLERIQEFFVDAQMKDFQKTAVFKAVFLSVGGADKWGNLLFEKGELPEELCRLLKKYKLVPVPEVKISCMPAQKVDVPSFSGLFHKFTHFFRKG